MDLIVNKLLSTRDKLIHAKYLRHQGFTFRYNAIGFFNKNKKKTKRKNERI